jgi:hypothetical protein
MSIIGWMGINENAWEDTEATGATGDQIIETTQSELSASNITWPFHRYSNSIMFTEIGPPVQEALAENTSPEDAMATAKETADSLCQDAIDELGEPGSWTIE